MRRPHFPHHMEPALTPRSPSDDGSGRRDNPKRVSALKKGLNVIRKVRRAAGAKPAEQDTGPPVGALALYTLCSSVWNAGHIGCGSPQPTWSEHEERGRESEKLKGDRCVRAAPHVYSCGLAGHLVSFFEACPRVKSTPHPRDSEISVTSLSLQSSPSSREIQSDSFVRLRRFRGPEGKLEHAHSPVRPNPPHGPPCV